MPDAVTDFFSNLLNGKTAGLPNIAIIIGVAMVILLFYLLLTRKPKPKEFKPMDLKKEIKKDTKEEFKYFSDKSNVFLFDNGELETAKAVGRKPKPIAFVLSIMKVVWNDQYKRYVPLYISKPNDPNINKRMETAAKEIYEKSFKELTEEQKKAIREVAREEARDEWVEIHRVGQKVRIVRGKREEFFNKPVATFCLKVTKADFLHRILANILGIGVMFFRFDAGQLQIENEFIIVKANYQRRLYNGQFIFSEAGKNIIDDIGFAKDREQQLQAIANETSKVQFFDSGLGQHVEKLREENRLDAEKKRAQSEYQNM